MILAAESPDVIQQQKQHACSIHRWQSGSTQNRQCCSANSPTAAYTQLELADQHLHQVERLEKQLFAKSDGWRGGVFTQELSKRNTSLLYALAAAFPCDALTDSKAPETQAAAASISQQQPPGRQHAEHQQHDQPAVLGYIIVQVNSVTAHINKLAVAPHARRQGVGAALLRAALQIATYERRALCATLHVDDSNVPAIALYCKAGFEKDGSIADYYGPGKPALKLLADLRESTAVAAFVTGGGSNTAAE